MRIITLLFVLISLKGLCCSCIYQGEINDEQFNFYDLIIHGEIEKVEEYEWTRTIYVRIKVQYKGMVKTELVLISSPSQSGTCGVFPKVGENWLIFANKSDGLYSKSLCTRTKNMNPESWHYNKDEIELDLKYLESKLKDK